MSRHMFTKLIGGVCLLVGIAVTQPSHAQSALPSTIGPPSVSPYMELFRKDGGLLPNYQQFVIPRQQLQAELNGNRQALTQLGNQIQVNRDAIQQSRNALRAAGVRPTGQGATFMNYSHYYPQAARGQ